MNAYASPLNTSVESVVSSEVEILVMTSILPKYSKEDGKNVCSAVVAPPVAVTSVRDRLKYPVMNEFCVVFDTLPIEVRTTELGPGLIFKLLEASELPLLVEVGVPEVMERSVSVSPLPAEVAEAVEEDAEFNKVSETKLIDCEEITLDGRL